MTILESQLLGVWGSNDFKSVHPYQMRQQFPATWRPRSQDQTRILLHLTSISDKTGQTTLLSHRLTMGPIFLRNPNVPSSDISRDN